MKFSTWWRTSIRAASGTARCFARNSKRNPFVRLLTLLLERRRRRGWLSDDDLRAVATEAKTPLYRVQELVSFYPHFRRQPPPRFEIGICRDVACRLANGPALTASLQRPFPGQ